MPRLVYLKCHRCGETFYPWQGETDDYGQHYCSMYCLEEEMHELARGEAEDKAYEDYVSDILQRMYG